MKKFELSSTRSLLLTQEHNSEEEACESKRHWPFFVMWVTKIGDNVKSIFLNGYTVAKWCAIMNKSKMAGRTGTYRLVLFVTWLPDFFIFLKRISTCYKKLITWFNNIGWYRILDLCVLDAFMNLFVNL